jgi:hypothetical protein
MGRSQSFTPGSKLDFLDTRIENVSTEFMRRSPRLKANWEEFKQCMEKSDCKHEPILAKRDEIIKAEWPTIFDRLIVHDDWGTLSFTAMAHDRFFSEIERVGGQKIMRAQCVPLIRYYHTPGGSFYRHYEDQGYRCNPPAPPPPEGGALFLE